MSETEFRQLIDLFFAGGGKGDAVRMINFSGDRRDLFPDAVVAIITEGEALLLLTKLHHLAGKVFPAFAALCKDGASCAEAAFFVAGFLDEPVFGFRVAREFIDGDHARQMVDVTDVFDVAQEIGKTFCESGKVFLA